MEPKTKTRAGKPWRSDDGPPLVAMDAWRIDTAQPRGIVNLKRQYARACRLLASAGKLKLCYAGMPADREWLAAQGYIGPGSTFRLFRIPGRLQQPITRFRRLPLAHLLDDAHLYHMFGPYAFGSAGMPVVGTLVDFVPTRLPQFVPVHFAAGQARWCQWAARQPSARWIAISDQVKRDALDLARVHPDQVHVVNLCAEDDMFSIPPMQDIAAVLDAYCVKQPYVLCVNTLNPRKNHEGLVAAWLQGAFHERGWSLVLVGHPASHPLADRLAAGEFPGVQWLGYVPRGALVHLYYGCELFVYPSLYEGFGIPVAEAIVAGKPVLTAQNSAMADVAAAGALAVDVQNVSSLREGLRALIESPALRGSLSEFNVSRRHQFSIQRLADDLLEAYLAILSAWQKGPEDARSLVGGR